MLPEAGRGLSEPRADDVSGNVLEDALLFEPLAFVSHLAKELAKRWIEASYIGLSFDLVERSLLLGSAADAVCYRASPADLDRSLKQLPNFAIAQR